MSDMRHLINIISNTQQNTILNEDSMREVSKESKKRCMQCGMTNCSCASGKCGCKPISGWVSGKGFKKDLDENINDVSADKLAEQGVSEGFDKWGKILRLMNVYIGQGNSAEQAASKLGDRFYQDMGWEEPIQAEMNILAKFKQSNRDVTEGLDPDTQRLEQEVRDALAKGDDYTAKSLAKMAQTPTDKKYLQQIIRREMYRKESGQDVAEGYEKKDMTGQTCEKCKKDKYQERSWNDDRNGTLQCSCGHVVDRWRKYKKKDDEQGVAEGYSNTTFNVDRRKLNVPALIQKGAILVTHPHGEQGWETDNKEDWAFSLLSLYNVLQGGWASEAKKYLKPESYKRAEQQINSSAPNLGSDKLVYDGKYNQILWSIKKLGIPDNVAFLDKDKQGVAEGFSDIVKGIKRSIKGKEHPDVVAAKHAGRAIGHYNQGDVAVGDKETKRYVKTRDMHLKAKGVAEGSEQSLSSMVNQDQAERNEYANFVKSQAGGDWDKGAKMYAQLKKRPSTDVFGDASRLNQFMKMKFDFDKFTDEDWNNYWLLAQHCDTNRDFQKNALSIIKKYQGTDHSHYKYLYDRISMGLTGKQKYGTQNVKKQGVAEGSKIAVDRKTGKVYEPEKEFDKLLKQHQSQFQGMAAIEKAQSQAKKTKSSKGVAEGLDPDTQRLEQEVRDALAKGDDYTAKSLAKMAQTAADRNYLKKIIRQEMYGTGPGQGGVAEGLAPGQAAWKKEMIAKGAVKFWRDQHGGGTVDRIVAYDKDGKVVGGFNRKGVAEGSDQELVNRQVSYWDKVAKGSKHKEREALNSKKAEIEKTPVGKAEKYWGTKGVTEGSVDKVHLKTPKYGLADHAGRNTGVGLRTFAQTSEQNRCSKCNSLFKNHYAKQDVAEGTNQKPNWMDLPDSLNMKDKLSIFESYYATNTLLESENHAIEYFNALSKYSADPRKGHEYIVVPIMLIQNRALLLNKDILKLVFVGRSANQYVFTDGDITKRFPSDFSGKQGLTKTFIFDGVSSYNKFRSAIAMKFDLELPDPSQDVAEGTNSSQFDQISNLKSKSNKELDKLEQFWKEALEKNPEHKVANDQLHIIKMIRAERIGKKGVKEGLNKTPKITFAQQNPGSWTRIDVLVDGVVKFEAVKTVGPGCWSIYTLDGITNVGFGGNKTELKAAVLAYLSKQDAKQDSLNEPDRFTSWYDWKDQANTSGYTITKKDGKIVALNKQGQVVGHWSDIGKFLSGKAPRPDFNARTQREKKNSLNEVSKDWTERSNAGDRIGEIVRSVEHWGDHTIDDINEVKRLAKLTGRAAVIRGGPGYDKIGTAGGILDRMIDNYRSKQMQSGQKPQFTGAATTAGDMAKQIATQTNGTYRQKYARVWTTGRGERYKDPSDFVEFKTDDDYDDAWEWIQSKGKKVYYYDNFKRLNTAIKIGKFIVEPASSTLGVFSDSPTTTHAISVRTAAVINKAVRRQVDITDQQAMALKDIAATKNKNAMDGIKLIMKVLQGEQDIKNIINLSNKLDPRDKAKLDKIISGASDFKEPDQGVTEGTEQEWEAANSKLYGLDDQDLVEDSDSGYKEIEFVCVNSQFPDATDPKLQKQMYARLKKIRGVIPLLQKWDDSAEQMSLTAIYKDRDARSKVLALAKELGVKVDLEQSVTDDYVDRAIRGEHEGQQDVTEGKKKSTYKVDVPEGTGNYLGGNVLKFVANNDDEAKEIARKNQGRNLRRVIGYDNSIKVPMTSKEEPLSPWYAGVGSVPANTGPFKKKEQDVTESKKNKKQNHVIEIELKSRIGIALCESLDKQIRLSLSSVK